MSPEQAFEAWARHEWRRIKARFARLTPEQLAEFYRLNPKLTPPPDLLPLLSGIRARAGRKGRSQSGERSRVSAGIEAKASVDLAAGLQGQVRLGRTAPRDAAPGGGALSLIHEDKDGERGSDGPT